VGFAGHRIRVGTYMDGNKPLLDSAATMSYDTVAIVARHHAICCYSLNKKNSTYRELLGDYRLC
jgi:hypothetical protein